MEEKTAYLISCSDHYGHRLNVADECLRSKGYKTTYITSDFDHTKKEAFTINVPGALQIHTRPYRKNLSIDRILSHREFARDVFRYLESLQQQPDVIVVLLPPNFLAHYAAKYKKHHPNVKLIFDIFDLWPETFPFGKLKKLLAPVFSVWAWLRDHNLGAADYIITECEMFRQRLNLPDEKSKTVYLCAEPLSIPIGTANLREEALDLCYLGAINNVIDIPAICNLLKDLAEKKPVTLHIIGKGEREQEFVDAAKATGAEVIFYGPIYDVARKMEIMSRCHLGLNIMKSSVCVGLTMKSVDYFRHGLPIINNIPADTQNLVEDYNVGVQLNQECVNYILKLSNDQILNMRRQVETLFLRRFARNVALDQYDAILCKILL